MADLRVLIIESDNFLRQSLRHLIEGAGELEIVGEAAELPSGHRLALHHRPDILFLEISEPSDAAFEVAEKLSVELPECMVIGMSSVVRPELMRRAMRAGFEDLIARPPDLGQIRSALELATHRKSQRVNSREQRGRMIAVLGVTGGLGTTTIAVNLAATLAQAEPSSSVLLADFDFNMGSVPSFLDLATEYTLLELKAEQNRIDSESLRQLLPRHRSGAFVLAGPPRIEDLEEITHEDVSKVIDLARQTFRTIVIDAGHGFDDRRMEVLDAANVILLVTQLNVAALRSSRRALEMLDRFGYDLERIKLVASRVGKGAAVSLADAQRSLGQTFAFAVPNDFPSAINAIDIGVPVVECRRSSRVAASINGMATALTADSSAGSRAGVRGVLARLRGRSSGPSRDEKNGGGDDRRRDNIAPITPARPATLSASAPTSGPAKTITSGPTPRPEPKPRAASA